jgi:hypothetical protein
MFNFTFKSLVLVISVFLTSASLAIADPFTTPPPNQYELHGGSLKIIYSTSGIDGKPHFNYQDGTQTLNFSGDQIRAVGTEAGTLVSVTTLMSIDTGSTSFTVLIPRINLDSTLQSNIRTEGISTRHKFSMIPDLNRGQLDTYKYTGLIGTANFVNF